MRTKRFCMSEEMGTFSKLFYLNEVFHVVEPPWMDNKPNYSCIPNGEYALIPYTSERHGETFKLVNIELKVYPEEAGEDDRFDIILHSGNTVLDTAGCPVVGKDLGFDYVNKKWAVTDSKNSMDKLRSLWHKQKPLKITIE